MARRTVLLVTSWFVLVLMAFAHPAEARDRSALHAAEKRGPTVDGELSFGAPLLRSGYRVALRKVDAVDSCQALFTRLGSDGVEVLQSTTYTMASGEWQEHVCRGAEAFTTVGGSRVWLCRGFGWMEDGEAATVLLHEALHNAGLGERPLDPSGPTADEIDEMVKRACRF